MIVINKENLLILLLTVIFIIMVLINFGRKGMDDSLNVFIQGLPLTGKIIVLDAGHGGRDPGATGELGINESDLNLYITLKLQRYLELSGAYVVLTRSDENGLYNLNVKNYKKSDMQERKRITSDSKADLFMSIHQNIYSDSRYSGAQVFYKSDCEKSKHMAKYIQTELKNILNKANKREEKEGNDYYLLKNIQIPALIIECGFLSNKEEEKNLVNDEYQENIAWAIYKGLLIYYKHQKID